MPKVDSTSECSLYPNLRLCVYPCSNRVDESCKHDKMPCYGGPRELEGKLCPDCKMRPRRVTTANVSVSLRCSCRSTFGNLPKNYADVVREWNEEVVGDEKEER